MTDPSGDLGLDHPLVTVRDRARALEAFGRLGFAPTPVTYHPWGTWTALIVLQRDLIELIGIHDQAAVEAETKADGFGFGAYVRDFLARGEGVSLLALHSDDIEADAERLARGGVPITRRIDFRRAVTLPDGVPDEAKVSLLILHAPELPEASQFVCQQHRPHCIWHPGWQSHPNGALGLTELVYLAAPGDDRLRRRLAALYGERALRGDADDLAAQTGNGVLRVMSDGRARARFGALPDRQGRPAAVAIGVRVTDLGVALAILEANDVPHHRTVEGRLRVDPAAACNVIVELSEAG
jgi:hypothetical protein